LALDFPSIRFENAAGKTRSLSYAVEMASVPDGIVLERDRDLEGRGREIWVRRGLFAMLPLVSVLALVNVFGQRPSSETVSSPAASLKLYAPKRVRAGLLWEARFHVTAHQELRKATLVLDPGWLEGMTANTIEPSPVNETSANGRLSFELGHIPAGASFLLFMDFQVNPTNVGHRSQTVELFDGDRKLLELDRSITIFP
jgi:hypothetical protein